MSQVHRTFDEVSEERIARHVGKRIEVLRLLEPTQLDYALENPEGEILSIIFDDGSGLNILDDAAVCDSRYFTPCDCCSRRIAEFTGAELWGVIIRSDTRLSDKHDSVAIAVVTDHGVFVGDFHSIHDGSPRGFNIVAHEIQ